MLYVWRLWNYANHSRAFVCAASRDEARRIRPDGAVWEHERWVGPCEYGGSPGWTAVQQRREVPQTLDAWPDRPEDVCADRYAKLMRSQGSDVLVLGYFPDATPRPEEDRERLRESDD